MSISENTLHPYIKGLVEENGKLTVTELNKLLREILVLDSDDLTLLSGRNDDKFSQIVRNVVAHSPVGKTDKYGYILDKTKRPAVFYAKENSSCNVEDSIITEKKSRNEGLKRINLRHEKLILVWLMRKIWHWEMPVKILRLSGKETD